MKINRDDIHLIDFGLDYLRVVFDNKIDEETGFFSSLYSGLSSNSHMKDISINNIDLNVEFRSLAGTLILDFRYGRMLVFTIEHTLDPGIGRYQSYVIKFYGSFFAYKWATTFLWSWIYPYKEYLKVTRVDIACDINVPVKTVREYGFKSRFRNFDFAKYEPETRNFQTWYIGKKHASNKRHFVRVYDKGLELRTKSQLKLAELDKYGTYVKNFTDIARIEAQINALTCSEFDIQFDHLFDNKKLKSIFASLVRNEKGTYLHILDLIWNKEPIVYKLSKSSQTDIIDHVEYAQRMLSYVKRLHEEGFDTQHYLVNNLYSL